MDIALVGFGSVGQALVALLRETADRLSAHHGLTPRLVAISTRSHGTLVDPDGIDLGALLDAGAPANAPAGARARRDQTPDEIAAGVAADVWIDAAPTDIRTGQPALGWALTALAAGKHVILANKGPVAVAHDALADAARAADRALRFEATVMAGTPCLSLAEVGLAGATITRARGILNGTTNVMLGRMEDGASYADALAEAQRLGYAETDPTADVDGWDAAGKALILAAAVLRAPRTLESIAVTGIRGIDADAIAQARAAGDRYKLIVDLTPTHASVAPVRLPLSDPLAAVSGALNAITYTTDTVGDLTLIGRGAGGRETAAALLADLIVIHRR